MNQSVLYKYFKGNASEEEVKNILEWVEESEKNRADFFTYRQVYDSLLFSTEISSLGQKRSYQMPKLLKWTIGTAAAILILISATLFSRYFTHPLYTSPQIVSVPSGQHIEMFLPDGTKVWLKAKSRLILSADFGRKSRNIELDGEAFFDVTKKEIPFTVTTEQNIIKVLGTRFNVRSYKGKHISETTLIEGLVDIYCRSNGKKIASLIKGDCCIQSDKGMRKTKLDLYDIQTWRPETYIFDSESFGSILKRLENYYDVKFEIENKKLLQCVYTAKFHDSDGIEHILSSLQKVHPFTFSFTGKKDTILIQ